MCSKQQETYLSVYFPSKHFHKNLKIFKKFKFIDNKLSSFFCKLFLKLSICFQINQIVLDFAYHINFSPTSISSTKSILSVLITNLVQIID